MSRARKFLLPFFLSAISLLLCFGAHASVRENFDACFPPRECVGVINATGERVKILEAEDKKYFLVLTKGGVRKRVEWEALTPLERKERTLEAVDKKTVAYFAGAMGMKSRTDYLLWTDLSRLQTYVLEYGDEGWQVLKILPSSVGDGWHPTPSGRYEVGYKCASIGKENLYLCRNALCFYGSYMYHSVLYDWSGENLIDARLGERISHGCIRLSPEDSRWLYEKIPIGTAVFIR